MSEKPGEMIDWQPIESAPKDGDPFLAYWCGNIVSAYWNLYQGNWQEWPDGDFEDIHGEELTHWMPLPEPPREK